MPASNQVFTNQELFAAAPMMRDGLAANRLGADAGQWDLLRTKCQVFPQDPGLLGSRTSVPILEHRSQERFHLPRAGCLALAAASRNGKAVVFDKQPLLGGV